MTGSVLDAERDIQASLQGENVLLRVENSGQEFWRGQELEVPVNCVYWGSRCGERKRRELRMAGGCSYSEKVQSTVGWSRWQEGSTEAKGFPRSKGDEARDGLGGPF